MVGFLIIEVVAFFSLFALFYHTYIKYSLSLSPIHKRMSRLLFLVIAPVLLWSCSNKPAAQSVCLADMDTTVRPQDDFFRYANGGWLDRNPIPADKGYYDISDELDTKIDQQLLGILDSLAASKLEDGSIQQKLTLFYKSGLDTATRNANRLKPLQFLLDSIDRISTIADLQHMAAKLNLFNLNVLFQPRCYPDMKNNKMCVFTIFQGGVGINENYFKYPGSEDVIAEYTNHIARLLTLAGYDNAVQMAETAVGVERKLAAIMTDYIQMQNPNNTYNQISLNELRQLMPVFDWDKFFADLGCRVPTNIVVLPGTQFVSDLNNLVTATPISDWKTYFKTRTINDMAISLSEDFVDEDFEFYERYMNGVEEKSPLPIQILNQINISYADAMGREYVNRYFSPATQKSAWKLGQDLKNAFREHITKLDWMSDDTKKAALEKVEQMKIKIGHPNKYVDYADCEVGDNYAVNIMNNFKAHTEHELHFVDMPIDNDLWWSTPQTANMYYLRIQNIIEVPAAMLQPPFFYPGGDNAVNYGAIGAAIGHELTHGFDVAGRFYDKNGNLSDWWADRDSIEFERRSQKLVERFNSFTVVDTLHVNGELTLSENIADLGGLSIAYTAFSNNKQHSRQEPGSTLTPDQLFFIAYARTWAGAYRDEAARMQTMTNEHALGKHRVEGPLPNLSAFTEAYGVKPGDRYFLADSLRTEIW